MTEWGSLSPRLLPCLKEQEPEHDSPTLPLPHPDLPNLLPHRMPRLLPPALPSFGREWLVVARLPRFQINPREEEDEASGTGIASLPDPSSSTSSFPQRSTTTSTPTPSLSSRVMMILVPRATGKTSSVLLPGMSSSSAAVATPTVTIDLVSC